MDSIFSGMANAVFALHLAFVLGVVLSSAALVSGFYRTRQWLLVIHCTGIYAMAAGQAVLRACPLVPLEHGLREAGGGEPWYSGSFIVFVVNRVTGFELPVAVVVAFSMGAIALTTAALAAQLANGGLLGASLRPVLARRP